MGRIIYSDGRTDLTTTAFRYKLTDSAGTLVKDWTTGATWTEEPAGTYYLDDEDAVPGTYYAVEPATGAVGATGQVPWDAPDNASAQAAAASAASVDSKLTAERLALIDGAAQETTVGEIADAVDALPNAPVGTRIDQTSEDASGAVLGLATPGSSITAYLASDTERTYPKRHTTAATDGTWALYLPAWHVRARGGARRLLRRR